MKHGQKPFDQTLHLLVAMTRECEQIRHDRETEEAGLREEIARLREPSAENIEIKRKLAGLVDRVNSVQLMLDQFERTRQQVHPLLIDLQRAFREWNAAPDDPVRIDLAARLRDAITATDEIPF